MIRAYAPADLEALKEITVVCFDGVSIDQNIEARLGRVGGRDWRWRKARHVDADVEGENARGVFVGEIDGAVVGYITARVDPESRVGWIPNLAVLPPHRGRGLGRKLLQKALKYLGEQGMECARIETLEQNPVGARLYPSEGFREVARQIHYVTRL